MTNVTREARQGQQPASQGVRRPTKKLRSARSAEEGMRTRIAARVRQLREEAGLTQLEAAGAAGMDPRTWQKLEAGTLNATLSILTKAGNALDVSPEALVAGTPTSRRR